MKDKRLICGDCRNRMTWTAQRVQFGRLRRLGMTLDEARALLPRCQKWAII